jgi:tripeptide aminopeptidase
MDNNKLERLKEILSIPSVSGREEKVRKYIADWATSRNIPHYTDKTGNIYLTKGESEYYPCMVAHMDTVHKIESSGIEIVEETYVRSQYDYSSVCDGQQVLRGYVKGKTHTRNNRTGCGGDDKAGIFLALEVMDKFDTMKCAFFISEEIGCIGSREADPDFFKDVAYTIQHDSPENDTISWYCSGYQLFSSEWAKPGVVIDEETGKSKFEGKIGDLLYDHGVRIFARHPFTDVSQLTKKFDFECINLPAAYYQYHTSNECVLIDGIEIAYDLSVAIIERLGNEKQLFGQQESTYNTYSSGNGQSYNYGSNYGSGNGYAYGYSGSSNNNWSGGKKYISQDEIKVKIKKYYKTKFNMSDDEFSFIFDGLHYYIDDFTGTDTITEIMEEYKDTPFYLN